MMVWAQCSSQAVSTPLRAEFSAGRVPSGKSQQRLTRGDGFLYTQCTCGHSRVDSHRKVACAAERIASRTVRSPRRRTSRSSGASES